MKRILIGLLIIAMLVACAPSDTKTDADDVAKDVAKQQDTEPEQQKQPAAAPEKKQAAPQPKETEEPKTGRTPPKQTPPSEKTQTKQEEQPPVQAEPSDEMDPDIRDLRQRAQSKLKNMQFIYGGTSTGNLFLDTYMVRGDQVRIKKFSEDYYVQEGYYDNIYVDQEIACCEEQSRCKSHNVDNTDTVFDVDVSLIDVPKTPYQWVMNIPASATVAGPQTFDERSVTYIKWNKDGKKYHGWFDDTYGVAHKIEIHDQDDQLLEKHQFNDLVFNNLQAADFEPPCV